MKSSFLYKKNSWLKENIPLDTDKHKHFWNDLKKIIFVVYIIIELENLKSQTEQVISIT